MPFFELTIGKLLEIIENIVEKTFGVAFENFKAFIFALSLLYSFNLILLWIYYEIKNKDEIGFWLKILNFIKIYKKSQRKIISFNEVKKIFQENNRQGLSALKNYFQEILEILGYPGENLIEKIEAIPTSDLPNKEDVLKAVKAINILEQREDVSLSKEENEIIFREIEKALYYLNIIEKEDFLVKSRE